MSERFPFGAFISHYHGEDGIGRDNHARVSKINEALKSKGVRTWFNEEQMQGNVDHSRAIEQSLTVQGNIYQSLTVIVCVTKKYIEKVDSDGNDNCKLEFQHALEHRTARNMIPVVMEEDIPMPWRGPVGSALGRHIHYSFKTDDELVQCVTSLWSQINAREESARNIIQELTVDNRTSVYLSPKDGVMSLHTLCGPKSKPKQSIKITMDSLQEVDEDGNVIESQDKKFFFDDKEEEKPLAMVVSDNDEEQDGGARGDSLSFSADLDNGSRFKVDAALVTQMGRVGSTYNGWEGFPGDFKFSFEVSDWDWETSGAFLDVHVEIDLSVGKVLPTISSKTYVMGDGDCMLELTREYFEIDESSNKMEQKFMPEGFPRLVENGIRQFFIFRFPRFETKVFYDPWLWFLRSRSGSFSVRSPELSKVNTVMFGYDRIGLTVNDYFSRVISTATSSSVFQGKIWQQYEIVGVQGQSSLRLDNESIKIYKIDSILKHVDPKMEMSNIEVILVPSDPMPDPNTQNRDNNAGVVAASAPPDPTDPQAVTGGSAEAPSPRPFDTFISHNWGMDESHRNNHARVVMIDEALKSQGVSTWIDEEQMQGNIHQRMSRGIEQSSTVIVCVTKRYIEKVKSDGNDNCKLEFQHALEHRTARNMILVVMEDIPMPVGNALGHHIHYSFKTDDELDQCVKDLVEQINARKRKNRRKDAMVDAKSVVIHSSSSVLTECPKYLCMFCIAFFLGYNRGLRSIKM